MAMNKFMHPRNPYKKKKPDFKELALKCPEFCDAASETVSGNVTVDFKDPKALKALTTALLLVDFDLKVTLPLTRLIPAVPQRLNYLLWLEDIVKGQRLGRKTIHGIDIGTGASCIFPLLGTKQFGWKFLCSEVDETNFASAAKNVSQNCLQGQIQVKQATGDDLLLSLVTNSSTDCFDFCMCNPPFFGPNECTSEGDYKAFQPRLQKSSSSAEDGKTVEPFSGAEVEKNVAGGEVAFVKQMIDESLKLKDKIRVYTSMVGRKSDLPKIKQHLRASGITKFASTEFCQGRTMRWAVGWSFDNSIQFPVSEFKSLSHLEKPPLVHSFEGEGSSFESICCRVKSILQELKIESLTLEDDDTKMMMSCKAFENTWAHQRRKRRQQQKQNSLTGSLVNQNEDRIDTNGTTATIDASKDSIPTPSKIARLETGLSCKDQEINTEAESGNIKNDSPNSDQCHGSSLKETDKTVTETDKTVTETDNRIGFINDGSKNSIQHHEGQGSDFVKQTISESSEKQVKRSDVIIEFMLSMTSLGNTVFLELKLVEGLTPDLLHQVMQFFKNRLK